MELSDSELVRAVQSGRREAYDELVRRHAGRIRAACWSKLGRRGSVDDMVQETFLRGFRAIRTIEDPSRFGNWLYGIAVRACLDWRKAKERSQVSFGSLGPDKNPDEFLGSQSRTALEGKERRDGVLDMVQALPEIYREVIVLFYFRKQTYQEMSAVLGVSPAAINARLTKARAMLREPMMRVMEP